MIWFFIVQVNVFFKLTILFYIISFWGYLYFAIFRKHKHLPTFLLLLALIFNAFLVIYYWINYKSFPAFTQHQKMILFTLMTIFIYLILENLIKFRLLGIVFSLSSIFLLLFSLNFYSAKVFPPIWKEILCFVFEIFSFSFLSISFFFSLLYLFFPETRELRGHWISLRNVNFTLYINRFVNISLILLFLTLFLNLLFIENTLWELTLKNEIFLLFVILYMFSFHLRKFEKWHGKRLAWVIVIGSLIIIGLNFV